MKTILACTDGSLSAASICDFTVWAARRLGAAVHVLHMIEPAAISSLQSDFSGAIGLDSQNTLAAELIALEQARARVAQARADAILKNARARLVDAGLDTNPIRVEARHGSLVDAVAKFDPTHDLIVIGKRGEQADLAKGHLGSNLERVIRISQHPVLVASRVFQPIQRALVAFDGSPSSRKAVEHAATSPLLTGVALHLVCVGTPTAAVKLELEAARVRLTATGHAVTMEQPAGHADVVIPEIVTRENIHLLVMGAYGHSRIREFFIGSTTSALIRTCRIPLLLFR